MFSIESDPANAAIAKKMVEIAGLSSVVTIIEGKVCDVIPKLKSEHYVTHVDFCFVDHWKDCYLSDVQLLEGSELLRPGSRVVADNILYPGDFARTHHTPVFRWLVLYMFCLRTGAPEFLKYMQENPWFESTCFSSPWSRTRLFHVANPSSRHPPPIPSRVQRQVHEDFTISYLICATGLVDDAILESIRREEPGKSLQSDSSDFLRTPEKTKACTPRVTESVFL